MPNRKDTALTEEIGVLGPLAQDEYYSIEKRKKSKDPFVLYWRIGKMAPQNENTPEQSMNQIMENLSKAGHWLFWRFNRLRDEETNIVVFTPSGAAEKQKLIRAYKELNSLGLIIRQRRQHYLCNPRVFLPRPGYLERVQHSWKNLKQTKKDK